jgi:hypothetical protein
MYLVRRGSGNSRVSKVSRGARLKAGALALGACLSVLALVHLVAVTGGTLRWGFLTQALVFFAISTFVLNHHQLREFTAARNIAVHLLICLCGTYLTLCLLARTVTVPAHDLVALTLAAFAEEVTFRLALPRYLSTRLSLLAYGAIISAVMAQVTFAAAHLASLESPVVAAVELTVLTVNGLLLLIIARRAGLGAAGISHAVFNAAGSVDLPRMPGQGPIQWALFATAGVLMGKTRFGNRNNTASRDTRGPS